MKGDRTIVICGAGSVDNKIAMINLLNERYEDIEVIDLAEVKERGVSISNRVKDEFPIKPLPELKYQVDKIPDNIYSRSPFESILKNHKKYRR